MLLPMQFRIHDDFDLVLGTKKVPSQPTPAPKPEKVVVADRMTKADSLALAGYLYKGPVKKKSGPPVKNFSDPGSLRVGDIVRVKHGTGRHLQITAIGEFVEHHLRYNVRLKILSDGIMIRQNLCNLIRVE